MERDAIEARFAAIEARLDAVERRLGMAPPSKPFVSDWQQINPLDRLSMPQSAMDDLAKAVPDKVVRDIQRDLRNPGRLR